MLTGHAGVESSRSRLRHNAKQFDDMVTVARARLETSRYLSAVEWCRAAAEFAMTNATGQLRSVELEHTIDAVANATIPQSRHCMAGEGKRRVLHVMTAAGEIGGLTRLAERWISRDTSSASSVAVTRQAEVPTALAHLVERSGGRAEGLGADGADSIERASRLRFLARGADTIVCHLHSDDIVPALAFGWGYEGAPVAFYNLADHLFWVAPTGATAVVDARRAGLRLTTEARGYDDDRSLELPLPIPRRRFEPDRSIRSRMGMSANEKLAISVARAIKFRDTALTPTFSALLAHALESIPDLVFCAVGPTLAESPWADLTARFGRRVHATGPVAEPARFVAAADIYLDTFPFSSTTSLLEAASAGLPVLSLDGHDGLATVLGLADFLVDRESRPRSPDAYIQQLRKLVSSEAERARRGAAVQDGYFRVTEEDAWLAQLQRMYMQLDRSSAAGVVLRNSPGPTDSEASLTYGLILLAVEQNVPLLWSLSGSHPRFDAQDQAGLTRRRKLTRLLRKVAGISGLSEWRTDSWMVPKIPGGLS